MLVSKLIPQVDPHVKIGCAKVSRKKTRKDYTFSLKLAKSQKGNFEQPPCVLSMSIHHAFCRRNQITKLAHQCLSRAVDSRCVVTRCAGACQAQRSNNWNSTCFPGLLADKPKPSIPSRKGQVSAASRNLLTQGEAKSSAARFGL